MDNTQSCPYLDEVLPPGNLNIGRLRYSDDSLEEETSREIRHAERTLWFFNAEKRKSIMTVGGPTVKLSNGVEMPLVGLGTWQSTPAEVKAAVHAAIDAGYRLIDTAAVYDNETSIGEAIKEAIDAGKIKREELFVTTKLWASHLGPKDSLQAAKDSVKRLGLEYVDLYLAHMPAAFNNAMSEQDHSVTVEDVWHGLEAVYEAKLARAIGVSNWSGEQIERAMKVAKVPIHNNQVELYLYWPQHDLHEISKKHNIVVTSYASLGSPGRVNFSLPSGAKLNWAPAPSALEDEHVLALAKKHNKSPAQILLRYILDRGIAIIPKSVNAQRIKENFNLFDFKLTADEIKELESTPHRQRLFLQDFMEGHPEDPFKNERNVSVRGFKVKFSNGVEMPMVGLGTWQSTQAEAKTAVHSAIDVGYRLIDTAAVYGNEVPIGEAIKEAIGARKIKRDELFVTTKLWTNHLSPKDSMQAAKDSLSRLGLEYVDLYLAHMPAAYTTDKSRQDHSVTVQDIWGGLETIYEAKMARAIGVSNWSAEQIGRVMNTAKIPIHNNQVELHLYWPQHELHEICENHNIVVTSYASLGSPGRMNQDRLPSGGKRHWAPAPSALEDKNVVALAKRHNKTRAQILLRYCLDRGVAIIPKSSNPQRIKENFNLFDFKLSPDEIRTLESAPHRQRLFLQDYLQGHPEDPFKNERK